MPDLRPLTSEEVLAQHIRENKAINPDPVVPKQPSAPNPTVPTYHENTEELNQKLLPKATGFHYRLPLGAYLLAFVYAQICALGLLAAAGTIAIGMLFGGQFYEIITSINSGLWIAIVISATLCLFIFSGRNVLRWVTIGICTILSLLFLYQTIKIVSMFAGTDMTSVIATAVMYPIAISLGMAAAAALLTLGTIAYLLRGKVAEIYE